MNPVTEVFKYLFINPFFFWYWFFTLIFMLMSKPDNPKYDGKIIHQIMYVLSSIIVCWFLAPIELGTIFKHYQKTLENNEEV